MPNLARHSPVLSSVGDVLGLQLGGPVQKVEDVGFTVGNRDTRVSSGTNVSVSSKAV